AMDQANRVISSTLDTGHSAPDDAYGRAGRGRGNLPMPRAKAAFDKLCDDFIAAHPGTTRSIAMDQVLATEPGQKAWKAYRAAPVMAPGADEPSMRPPQYM